jgi:hypothetical protein
MQNTLTTSKSRVEFLLENYPSLRDDDKKLWVSYLVMFHNLQEVLTRAQPFEALCSLLLKEDVASCETLRRLRQKLQENGAYAKELSDDLTRQSLHRLRAKGKKVEDTKIVTRSFNVNSRVEHLLKNYDALRDNDTQLWLAYLVMFHGLKQRVNESISPYDDFCDIVFDNDVPNMQSIRRSRQHFQERGFYLGEKRKNLYSKASGS